MKRCCLVLVSSVVLVYLTACSSYSLAPTEINNTKPSHSASPTIFTATPIVLPTIEPTITQTVQPTLGEVESNITESAPTVIQGVQYQCPEILPDVPTGKVITGTLVMKGLDTPSYLLNLESKSKRELPDQDDCLLVSPDGEYLAHCTSSATMNGQSQLAVETVDGKTTNEITIDDSALYWLNNKQLATNIWMQESDSDFATVKSVQILDPFTGNMQEFSIEYPDAQLYGGAGGSMLNFRSVSVAFDPSLNLVVYPQETKELDHYIVLWNLEKEQEIAKLPTRSLFDHTPVWSSNGQFFVVPIYYGWDPNNWEKRVDEWFLMSREGQVQQLTHFEDTLANVIIYHAASLSPNGQYLAFWLTADPSPVEGQHLVLLNMTTLDVTEYCIEGVFNVSGSTNPVWSPDSRYLVVNNYYADNLSRVYLLDTLEGWGAQVAENAVPMGWMKSP